LRKRVTELKVQLRSAGSSNQGSAGALFIQSEATSREVVSASPPELANQATLHLANALDSSGATSRGIPAFPHEPQQEQQMISMESSMWAMPLLMRRNETTEPPSLLSTFHHLTLDRQIFLCTIDLTSFDSVDMTVLNMSCREQEFALKLLS
jgi:hypothetical protein